MKATKMQLLKKAIRLLDSDINYLGSDGEPITGCYLMINDGKDGEPIAIRRYTAMAVIELCIELEIPYAFKCGDYGCSNFNIEDSTTFHMKVKALEDRERSWKSFEGEIKKMVYSTRK